MGAWKLIISVNINAQELEQSPVSAVDLPELPLRRPVDLDDLVSLDVELALLGHLHLVLNLLAGGLTG